MCVWVFGYGCEGGKTGPHEFKIGTKVHVTFTKEETFKTTKGLTYTREYETGEYSETQTTIGLINTRFLYKEI